MCQYAFYSSSNRRSRNFENCLSKQVVVFHCGCRHTAKHARKHTPLDVIQYHIYARQCSKSSEAHHLVRKALPVQGIQATTCDRTPKESYRQPIARTDHSIIIRQRNTLQPSCKYFCRHAAWFRCLLCKDVCEGESDDNVGSFVSVTTKRNKSSKHRPRCD